MDVVGKDIKARGRCGHHRGLGASRLGPKREQAARSCGVWQTLHRWARMWQGADKGRRWVIDGSNCDNAQPRRKT